MKTHTVIISPYSPQWPLDFEALRAKIWPVVAQHAAAIEHVGSTAVPGLCAKSIIDLDIIVGDEERMAGVMESLAGIGYRHVGDLGITGREAFTPVEPPTVPHHLYACLAGNEALSNHLILRDHLRRHPKARDAYGQLKTRLAAAHRHDIDAYIAGKTAFIEAILAQYPSPEG